MRKHIHYISIALLFFLTSCEKVINIDTADGSGKIVVEGVITNQSGTCMVLVSSTKQFSESNDFAGISGANVTITETGGATTTLTETAPGVYQAASLAGSSGKTYQLRVESNGQVFTSNSTMPAQVPLDTAFTKEEELFGDTRLLVQAEYKDPAGQKNYYRFIQYVNGIKEKSIFIRDDGFSDGNEVKFVLRYFSDDDEDDLKAGDNIRIQMQCIDANVHKYWFSLDQSATGDNQSAAPSNPVSNISGGALGYFSAHTLQTREFVVQ
ncbi:MAG: DUF4249 domain-containing protein [Chitinophagaceae bacterium]